MTAIWSNIKMLLDTNTDLLGAAIVSIVVSAVVSYFFKRSETRFNLEAEYEYEQRKKLRNLIGEFHGRLLNATNSLNYRIWNIYHNHRENWLGVLGDYSPENHYFHSSVHRFLVVSALIRQFERRAVFVDARIAKKEDFIFLKYIAALHWCMTDVSLFEGLEYDKSFEIDHFFSDNFRQYCDSCIGEDGSIIEFGELVERVQEDRSIDPVLGFFDNLSPNEDRYRWDRLVTFHLLLIGFINNFGYRDQKISQKHINLVVTKVKHPKILKNLAMWLPRHGLTDRKGGKQILRACTKATNK